MAPSRSWKMGSRGISLCCVLRRVRLSPPAAPVFGEPLAAAGARAPRRGSGSLRGSLMQNEPDLPLAHFDAHVDTRQP